MPMKEMIEGRKSPQRERKEMKMEFAQRSQCENQIDKDGKSVR